MFNLFNKKEAPLLGLQGSGGGLGFLAGRLLGGVEASGGSVQTYGAYKSHKFTSLTPNTFDVQTGGFVDILIVGGGGGGGGDNSGGGGAGAVRVIPNVEVADGVNYSIQIGQGGRGCVNSDGDATPIANNQAYSGGASRFQNGGIDYVANGGGLGASAGAIDAYPSPNLTGGAESQTNSPGGNGSGGGERGDQGPFGGAGSGGTYGYNGGTGASGAGGGGGGAGAVGQNGNVRGSELGGNGGAGIQNDYETGTNQWYGAGGGGGNNNNVWNVQSPTNGIGGVTNGPSTPSTAGATNTGSGGGGGTHSQPDAGAPGGSGVIVIRYLLAGTPSLTASGGTKTTSGNQTIHTFTGPGTFTVTDSTTDLGKILLVGGGGGGGGDNSGGGGAGCLQYRENFTIAPGSYPINIGSAGDGAPGTNTAAQGGGATTGMSITAPGGGKGGTGDTNLYSGGAGGSGGGGAGEQSGDPGSGGNAGGSAGHPGGIDVVSPNSGWGNPGGGNSNNGGGGGGGAGARGSNGASDDVGGNGGNGARYSISGSTVYYAGGGGGGNENDTQSPEPQGGLGGGGNHNYDYPNKPAAANGDANTGGGGGGGTYAPTGGCTGGNGGTGIVIISYPS